jgi:hypothetical protein
MVDVLSELFLGSLPGFTPVIFGGCVVWTFIGSSSWFQEVDPTKVETTHPPNITGVKPGTGTNKSSDNTSTKYNRGKTRNWTLQKFRLWTFVGSSSWSYSRYIWCMCCLNFCWIHDPTKVQTTHPPNITVVKPGTGPYKVGSSS